MRINLDYYRILNVSIEADLAQLNLAYQDRLQQQPRHEYSNLAIAERKKILGQAYSILSDSETREEYDNNFFTLIEFDNLTFSDLNAESTSPDSFERVAVVTEKAPTIIPYIEVEPELLVGALTICYELAEYETVLRLGNEYLQELEQAQNYNSSYSLSSNTATKNSLKIEQKPDILLSLALSYLDLSREQWQREEFEKAATSGNEGLKLLKQENCLFPRLQREIEEELNLLKPYRILELLGQNPPDSPLRAKGLKLLQEMLLQQDGIEGKKHNISGLKSDQFLYFIQQIRTYLTLQEQKEIFLAETKRGSHPGSCVAAYALIAEGYAHKKPSSILQAQKILQNLSHNQNTDWEKAICALLLGQTVESQAIIQQSQETETLNLIKQYSAESPDLLPGLCFYGQQWLQKKVLAQFQDLKFHNVTLADYFNDSTVQTYIEKLSPITNNHQQYSDRQKVFSQTDSAEKMTYSAKESTTKFHQIFPWLGNKKATDRKTSESANFSQANYSEVKTPTTSSAFAETNTNNTQPYANPTLTDGDRVVQLPKMTTKNPKTKEVQTSSSSFVLNEDREKTAKTKVSPLKSSKTKFKKSKKSSSGILWTRVLLVVGLIGGLGALSFALTQRGLENSSKSSIVVESATPPDSLVKPPTEPTTTTPKTTAKTTPATTPKATVKPAATDVFNQELAQKVIQKWLDSKTAALGKEYQTKQLDSIVTGALLTQWQNTSVYYKQNNIYRQFEHTLKISSYKVNPENPNLATVEAEVNEVAEHYQKGQVDRTQSYRDRLLVSYELVRQNGLWLIKNSKVVRSL